MNIINRSREPHEGLGVERGFEAEILPQESPRIGPTKFRRDSPHPDQGDGPAAVLDRNTSLT